MTIKALEIWKARAIAALPIIEAAIKLTDVRFDLINGSRVLLPANDYRKLHKAVHAYLEMAKQESDRP